MDQLRPTPTARHSSPATFVHKDLQDYSHVFLRQDNVRRALQPPYSGPHQVIARTDKTHTIVVRGRHVTVSTDRVKPAYLLGGNQHDGGSPPAQPSKAPTQPAATTLETPKTTRSGRTVRFPARFTT